MSNYKESTHLKGILVDPVNALTSKKMISGAKRALVGKSLA